MNDKKPQKNFRRLVGYVFRHRSKLFLGLGFSVLVAILHGVSLGSALPVFDAIVSTQEEAAVAWKLPGFLGFLRGLQDFLLADRLRGLCLVAGFVVVLIAVKGLLRFSLEYLIGCVATGTARDISNELYDRTVDLSLDFYTRTDSSAGMTRFTNDLAAASSGVKTVFGKLVAQPLQFAVTLVVMLFLSRRLTLLTILVFPFIVLASYLIGKQVRKAAIRALGKRETLLSILKESFLGIRIIKAFQMEEKQKQRFFKENQRLLKQEMRIVGAEALMSPLMEVLGTVGICLMVVAGGYLVLSDAITRRALITFYFAAATLMGPPRKLANVNNRIQMMLAGCSRIFAFMDQRPSVKDVPGAAVLPRLTHSLKFEDVSFSYDGKTPVLDHISFEVRPGERVAVVGLSGAGKSTLISLIPRFYDPSGGQVTFDGHDIATATLASVRDQVGLVTQEVILFNDTVLNNIAFGRKDSSREDILAAASKAHVAEFAERLPQGYDTVVGEQGATLSGGQRQRVALARAILKDSAVLILDEATSALDSESESYIQEALADFMKTRASIIIAHRLATVEGVDRILVLKDGRLEAMGKHQELVRSCPFYRRLYQAQFPLVEGAEIQESEEGQDE